jgi:hypothetical protein
MPGQLRNGGNPDEDDDIEDDAAIIDLDLVNNNARIVTLIRDLNNEITRLRRLFGHKPHYLELKDAIHAFYSIILASEAFHRNSQQF